MTAMSNTDWLAVALFVWAMALMYRMDRLGKQLEAVCRVLQLEMSEATGNGQRKRALMTEWRGDEAENRKASRASWWFWGIIGVVAATLIIMSRN
jgi:hypothetical protein